MSDSLHINPNMPYQEKLHLLESISLLKHMPERTLKVLAEYLKPRAAAHGAVIFEEGRSGTSIYFLVSGRIRIYKRTASGSTKELAVVAPGDFFGEMAIIEQVPRSASAAAIGECVMFELFSGDLTRWIKASPQQAVEFFAQLSHVQSKRLRKTSAELTLHADLSDLLTNQQDLPEEFLREALVRIVSHLEGTWSAAAYLSAGLAGSMMHAASEGSHRFPDVDPNPVVDTNTHSSWLDDETFRVALTRNGKALGSLLFRAPSPLTRTERDDLALTLTPLSISVTTGLEMISLRDSA